MGVTVCIGKLTMCQERSDDTLLSWRYIFNLHRGTMEPGIKPFV